MREEGFCHSQHLGLRWVRGIPENESEELLSPHFTGTQRVLARPQPIKVEAYDVALCERSREQE
jgi:hypothetical protein